MVYHLYGLSYEEAWVIDKDLNQEELSNFKEDKK